MSFRDGTTQTGLNWLSLTQLDQLFGASNYVSSLPAARDPVVSFACKQSASERVLKSVRNGAVVGAAKGAIYGFWGGTVFGGEVTLGLSGVAGAGAGAIVGGATGSAGGLASGFMISQLCRAAGAYN